MSSQPATAPISRAARAKREIARRLAAAELGRQSFADFFRMACDARVIGGVAKIEWGPHLDLYCWSVQLQLEAWLVAYGLGTAEMVARQREAWERTGATWEDEDPEPWLRYVLVQNQLDNLPPTTLKSTIAMVAANAWIWLWAPKFSFIAASGVEANVERDSMASRDLVTSPWYRELFGIAWATLDLPDPPELGIRTDQDKIRLWGTTAGGKRDSRTINSGWVGAHGDGIFIDDPDDPDKVWNEADRIKPQNRFSRAIENRTNDDRRTIRRVLQQRVKSDDFSSYLLSLAQWSPQNPRGWFWFVVPAEYGHGPEGAPSVSPYGQRDWRSDQGEVIHKRLSAGVLADWKLKTSGYEAIYNQNPDEYGTGIFERQHARWFIFEGESVRGMRARPEGCLSRIECMPVVIKLADLTSITLSVDAANSLNPKPGAKVSAVGLTVGGCRDEERYWLDDQTKVLGVSATYRAIFETARIWRLDRILVEMKALGAGVVDEVMRAIRRGWYLDADTDERIDLVGPDGRALRCEVEAVDPGREDKVQRAHAWLPAWEQHLVFFHDGADWVYPRADSSRKTLDEGAIAEVCSFPASRRRDRVDAWGQFVARYRGSQDTRQAWRAMRRLAQMGARR